MPCLPSLLVLFGTLAATSRAAGTNPPAHSLPWQPPAALYNPIFMYLPPPWSETRHPVIYPSTHTPSTASGSRRRLLAPARRRLLFAPVSRRLLAPVSTRGSRSSRTGKQPGSITKGTPKNGPPIPGRTVPNGWTHTSYGGRASYRYYYWMYLYGGRHGKKFDDSKRPGIENERVKQVTLYGSSSRLTGIEFTYHSGLVIIHGTKHKNYESLTFEGTEAIQDVSFSRCKKGGRTRVCSARFTTDADSMVELGDMRKSETRFTVPPGSIVIGMYGREGKRLDSVGLIAIDDPNVPSPPAMPPAAPAQRHLLVHATQDHEKGTVSSQIAYSEPVGGRGGAAFDSKEIFEIANSNFRDAKITKIVLFGGRGLQGLQLVYTGGLTFSVGPQSGQHFDLDLNDGEHVTKVTVTTCNVAEDQDVDQDVVCGISFTTNENRVVSTPNGGGKGETFEVPEGSKFVGLAGNHQGKYFHNLKMAWSPTKKVFFG